MSNKNLYNQYNYNIRNNGGIYSWFADINDEIYQNIDNIENTINNVQSIVNNIINSDLPLKQNQINDILNIQLPQNQNILSNYAKELEEQKKLIIEQQKSINVLDNKFKIFEESAIDNLAKHFDIQSENLKKEKDYWYKILIYTVIVFVLFYIILFSIIVFTEKLSLINSLYLVLLVNVFLISIFYFVVSQYSSYKRLQLEYENRSVVSKSYFGILNQSNAADSNIITKIVADTLFSRNVTDQGAELPLKDITRVIEKVTDKRHIN